MKRYHPLSTAGLTARRSSLAMAALCGVAAVQQVGAEVLVNLDATGLSEGPLATWTNTGSAGNFASSGSATPAVVTQGGVKGVNFTGGSNNYLGPAAPEQITGAGARTIEAWVFNPTGSDFETIIAWGHRGADNRNCSFSHGVHPVWGAFGGWAAGDLDWTGDNGEPGTLKFGAWNYIAYTYDGATSSVYSDGLLANSEGVTLDTFAVDDSSRPLPFRLGAQNLAPGTIETGEAPTMVVARVRVHDTALTAEEIAAKFASEKSAFGFNDDDNDGLPNSYEQQYSGILNPNDPTDAAKDSDNDGLTNLQEFAAKTLPNNPDTDGDGAKDGDELNRAGGATDPLVADTDGDGLSDGAENAAGTDPLKQDSDDDGFFDGQEVLHGSNPLVAGSTPSFPTPLISLDATALAEGALAEWANTGLLPGNFAAAGTPTVTTVNGVKGVTFNGNTDFYTGPATPGFVTGGENHSVEAWVYNPVTADEETIFSWGRRGGPDGSNVSFNHGVNATWGAVGHWGGPDIGWGETPPSAGRWTYVVYTWDKANLATTVYQDGVESNTETTSAALNIYRLDSANQPLHFRVATQTDANGSATAGLRGSMTIARVRVHDRTLSAAEITAKFNAEAAEFGSVDFDNDGLPTSYEQQYPGILNPNDPTDAAKDPDGDGLTNLEEFNAGTRPDVADTDGDGVKDGAEVKRTPTPTNPLVGDTDQDGLSDGQETATDPTVADTDGDGFADGQEVFHGSSPTNNGSTPTLTPPVKLVDLQAANLTAGPLASWPNAGQINAPFVAGETQGVVENVAGVKAVTLDGTQYYTGPSSPVFVTGDAAHTIDAWIYNPAAADEETIFSWGRRGGGDGSNVSFNHGLNGTYGAVGHWGAPDVGWSGKVYTGRWTHVAYTYDPATTTATVYADGQVATSKVTGALAIHAVNDSATAPTPLPFRLGSQNDANGAPTGGLRGSLSVGRVRVYDGVLSADAIAQIYNSELATYTPPANIAFEAPVYDAAANRITLKWSPVSAATYKLEGTSDFKTWSPVANGLTADTYVIENVSTKPTTFFRVSTE